ncbi:MAG: hypothetical protein ACREQI_03805 [Candidatus Binataceae bacterium]
MNQQQLLMLGGEVADLIAALHTRSAIAETLPTKIRLAKLEVVTAAIAEELLGLITLLHTGAPRAGPLAE